MWTIISYLYAAVMILPVAVIFLLSYFYYDTIRPMLIKPIHPSSYYHKSILGIIYYDSTSGCFDVCWSKSFTRLPEADTHTFQVLTVASPFTFGDKIIDSDYAKDTDTVYFQQTIIPEADAPTFTAQGLSLGKDAWQYYLYDKRLASYIKNNIDASYVFNPMTLEVISYDPFNYIILKNEQKYYFVKLNVEPMTIRSISSDEANRYNR